ncbi:MAG: FimB/Mfa2 family fimbrial subunit, partial [Bacteroidales bacterium]|nr:FimB/Mfa2 family fimbrial subunit [Bacteroidales bacterium]
MKQTCILLMAAVALSFGACTHKTHFEVDMPQDEQTDKYPAPDGLGYLGNDLSWEDIADVMSDISHIRFTVTGTNGVKETHEFTNPTEASEWMLPLPVGEYDVLVAANMDASNGFELSETVPTKAAHSLPATYTKLTDASSNPHQAWNGIAHVKVENDKMATVHLDLDRLLALFTLRIKNVPEGTTIDVSMRNAASYVTLTDERTASHWGLPSEEISDDITLGQLNAANALSAIDEFKVFPTATGLEETIIFF